MNFKATLIAALFGVVMLSGFNAKADLNVQVSINNEVYTCAKGGTVAVDPCLDTTQAAESKYSACKSAGYSGPSCFQQAYPTKVASCTTWSNSCNTKCKDAGYSGPSCYQTCF